MRTVLALLALLASLHAGAQATQHCVTDIRGNQACGTRPDQCVLDRYRAAWCAPANGIAMTDRHGEVVCGAGSCVRDPRGEIVCSGEPGGAISIDASGKPACAGGCMTASRSACRRMTPN